MVGHKNMSQEKTDESNDFLKEFLNESDRGAALLGAAMLDTLLQQLLANYLIEDGKVVEEIFGGAMAPLHGFSAKTKMAYYLGLISRDECGNIDLIRGIRNKFAHKIHGLSFEDQGIKEACRKLKFDKSANDFFELNTPRHVFVLAVATLLSNLATRSVNRCKVYRGPRGWVPFKKLKW